MVTSISSAARSGADDPPGTTAFSRPLPVTPPACSKMSWRRVTATDVSYTPGRFTRPDTEYMRVPPCVAVPSDAKPRGAPVDDVGHAGERLHVVHDGRLPKAPLIAGKAA
jgi:hypothetical protein